MPVFVIQVWFSYFVSEGYPELVVLASLWNGLRVLDRAITAFVLKGRIDND
jgi:hypothetical protein